MGKGETDDGTDSSTVEGKVSSFCVCIRTGLRYSASTLEGWKSSVWFHSSPVSVSSSSPLDFNFSTQGGVSRVWARSDFSHAGGDYHSTREELSPVLFFFRLVSPDESCHSSKESQATGFGFGRT